jgi:DNA-binding ferritin-like protein
MKMESSSKMENGAKVVASALKDILCNVIVFYFSAHRAHWNVAGPAFTEYHQLFGAIYDDVYDAVDDLAENIRKCGEFPPTLMQMVEGASFKDESMSTDPKELVIDLYRKNVNMISMLKSAFNVANDADEQGVANFIAERIDMHQKWGWQLKSSVVVEEIPETPEEEESEMEEDSSDKDEEVFTLTAPPVVEPEAILTLDSSEEVSEIKDLEDAVKPTLGKRIDLNKIIDEEEINKDTAQQRLKWSTFERNIAKKYKELYSSDINRAEVYLVDQIRKGFISKNFNPKEVI